MVVDLEKITHSLEDKKKLKESGLLNTDEFIELVEKVLNEFMQKNIPSEFLYADQFRTQFIKTRYFNCLYLDKPPKRIGAIDYYIESNSKTQLDTAAQSCEFYGGVFHRSFTDKKMISLRVIKNNLQGLYDVLAKHKNNEVFEGFSEHTEHIISAYQQTSEQIIQIEPSPFEPFNIYKVAELIPSEDIILKNQSVLH